MTACALWSESHSFSQSLITTLKSHIGTPNNNSVWMFLSCLSEYFEIEKPEFVMEYYMDALSKVSFKCSQMFRNCINMPILFSFCFRIPVITVRTSLCTL